MKHYVLLVKGEHEPVAILTGEPGGGKCKQAIRAHFDCTLTKFQLHETITGFRGSCTCHFEEFINDITFTLTLTQIY